MIMSRRSFFGTVLAAVGVALTREANGNTAVTPLQTSPDSRGHIDPRTPSRYDDERRDDPFRRYGCSH